MTSLKFSNLSISIFNNILGFIFYKYLSEKTLLYANSLLKSDGKSYKDLPSDFENPYIKAVKTYLNLLKPIKTYQNL